MSVIYRLRYVILSTQEILEEYFDYDYDMMKFLKTLPEDNGILGLDVIETGI